MVYLDWAATSPTTIFHRRDCEEYEVRNFNSHANYALVETQCLERQEQTIKQCLGTKTGCVFFGGTATSLMQDIKCVLGDKFSLYAEGTEHNAVYNLANQNDPRLCNLYAKMLVNNVTGVIATNLIQLHQSLAKQNQFLIVDLTAAIGKVELPPQIDSWADAVFWSTHKLGGEGNAGVLWVSDRFNKHFHFAENYHQGTIDLYGAIMSARACLHAINQLGDYKDNCEELICELSYGLDNAGIKAKRLGYNQSYPNAPIVALMIEGLNADLLQNYLATKQIYVGLGASACAAQHDYRVLLNSGCSAEEAWSTIRVSFGLSTSKKDIAVLVDGIVECYQKFSA